MTDEDKNKMKKKRNKIRRIIKIKILVRVCVGGEARVTDGHKCGRSGRQSGQQSAVGPSRNYQKFLILTSKKYIGPSAIRRV